MERGYTGRAIPPKMTRLLPPLPRSCWKVEPMAKAMAGKESTLLLLLFDHFCDKKYELFCSMFWFSPDSLSLSPSFFFVSYFTGITFETVLCKMSPTETQLYRKAQIWFKECFELEKEGLIGRKEICPAWKVCVQEALAVETDGNTLVFSHGRYV